MSIIYVIVKVLTLPGAVIHAFFEHMVCRSAKVIVEDERVLQFNEMLSHVDHQLIKRKGPSFDICFIPFFMNLFLGFLTLCYGSTMIIYLGKYADIFGITVDESTIDRFDKYAEALVETNKYLNDLLYELFSETYINPLKTFNTQKKI